MMKAKNQKKINILFNIITFILTYSFLNGQSSMKSYLVESSNYCVYQDDETQDTIVYYKELNDTTHHFLVFDSNTSVVMIYILDKHAKLKIKLEYYPLEQTLGGFYNVKIGYYFHFLDSIYIENKKFRFKNISTLNLEEYRNLYFMLNVNTIEAVQNKPLFSKENQYENEHIWYYQSFLKLMEK